MRKLEPFPRLLFSLSPLALYELIRAFRLRAPFFLSPSMRYEESRVIQVRALLPCRRFIRQRSNALHHRACARYLGNDVKCASRATVHVVVELSAPRRIELQSSVSSIDDHPLSVYLALCSSLSGKKLTTPLSISEFFDYPSPRYLKATLTEADHDCPEPKPE